MTCSCSDSEKRSWVINYCSQTMVADCESTVLPQKTALNKRPVETWSLDSSFDELCCWKATNLAWELLFREDCPRVLLLSEGWHVVLILLHIKLSLLLSLCLTDLSFPTCMWFTWHRARKRTSKQRSNLRSVAKSCDNLPWRAISQRTVVVFGEHAACTQVP